MSILFIKRYSNCIRKMYFCNEASKSWQQYDEYIEKDKIRKINLSKINKLFKNNNLGKTSIK